MQTYGVGAYSFFRDNAVTVESGMEDPKKPGVQMTNNFIKFLNGFGAIRHVVDESGNGVDGNGQIEYYCGP